MTEMDFGDFPDDDPDLLENTALPSSLFRAFRGRFTPGFRISTTWTISKCYANRELTGASSTPSDPNGRVSTCANGPGITSRSFSK